MDPAKTDQLLDGGFANGVVGAVRGDVERLVFVVLHTHGSRTTLTPCFAEGARQASPSAAEDARLVQRLACPTRNLLPLSVHSSM